MIWAHPARKSSQGAGLGELPTALQGHLCGPSSYLFPWRAFGLFQGLNSVDLATFWLSDLLGDPRLLGDSDNYTTSAGSNVIQPWPSETSTISRIGKFLRMYGFFFVEIKM